MVSYCCALNTNISFPRQSLCSSPQDPVKHQEEEALAAKGAAASAAPRLLPSAQTPTFQVPILFFLRTSHDVWHAWSCRQRCCAEQSMCSVEEVRGVFLAGSTGRSAEAATAGAAAAPAADGSAAATAVATAAAATCAAGGTRPTQPALQWGCAAAAGTACQGVFCLPGLCSAGRAHCHSFTHGWSPMHTAGL